MSSRVVPTVVSAAVLMVYYVLVLQAHCEVGEAVISAD